MHILFNFTRVRSILFIVLCFCFVSGWSNSVVPATVSCDLVQLKHKRPNPVYFKFFKKKNQRKKVIASALAFPFPFGMLGVHRIYLGTQPYIPLVYVGTLGGCAGIIPMIDFCTLVSNKDISRFQANSRIFMWVDNEKKK